MTAMNSKCVPHASGLGPFKRPSVRKFAALTVVLPLLFSGCEDRYSDAPSTSERSAQSSGTSDGGAKPSRSFSRPSVRMPAHGALMWFDSPDNTAIMKENIRNGGYGRLQISVPSGEKTYFIKLKELSPRRGDVLGAVIEPGRTLTIKVPIDGGGSTIYDLHYGAGTSWYGPQHAFGPSGAYSKADDTLAFKAGSGWEVELIAQFGGNLGTSDLDYERF